MILSEVKGGLFLHPQITPKKKLLGVESQNGILW